MWMDPPLRDMALLPRPRSRQCLTAPTLLLFYAVSFSFTISLIHSQSYHSLFTCSLFLSCYSVPPRIVVKSRATQILTYPHAFEMATPRTPTTETLSSYPYYMDFLMRRRHPSTCCCPQRQWTKGAPFNTLVICI